MSWLLRRSFPELVIYIFFVIFFSSVSFAHAAKRPGKYQPIKEPRLSVKPLDSSTTPSIDDLISAGQMGGRLYPTQGFASPGGGIPKSPANASWMHDVNLSFGKAIQSWNKHDYKKAVEQFKEHLTYTSNNKRNCPPYNKMSPLSNGAISWFLMGKSGESNG